MRKLNEKIPNSFEISIGKKTNGEKMWQSFFRNPVVGVSYMFFDLGSPTYLGNAHLLYPFMNFSLTNAHRPVGLNFRLGAGVAHIEKVFDPVENYKNMAISTHLNAVFNIMLECRVRVFAPLHLLGGLAITHTSNGTVRRPNSGLNYVTAFAGASYAFGNERPLIPAAHSNITIDKKWHYTVYLSGGVKRYIIYDDTLYGALGLSFEASRAHLAFTRFSGALELFYDASDYASLVRNGIKTNKIQTVKTGFAAGYSFHFGALSANAQLGTYLYAKNRNIGSLYQRYALNYSATERINVRLGFKAHLGQVDYIEFAIGYRI